MNPPIPVIKLLGLLCPITEGSSADCGAYDPTTGRIQVAPGMSPSVQGTIALHEITEAINDHLELRLKHRQVTAISQAFYEMIVNNPEFIIGLIARKPIM
jgi:hypothetical protein